jgi:hypothetical protein
MTRGAIRGLPGVVGSCMLLAAATFAGAQPVAGLKPAAPQPTAVYCRFNNINEFADKKFEPGPPLAHLDWKMGAGIVLTSKEKDQVGALITGFIRFDKAGTFGFDVTSNDGVRVEIGGKLLYEDPTVHGDDTSDRIDVKIGQPGWYPLQILYFEKKGTATLVLRWAPAGADAKAPLVPVPAAAFARPK